MKKILAPFICYIIICLIPSCRSSYITSSWKSDKISVSDHKKILVLGMIRDSDRSLQQKMEEHMAGDLREKGYNAVTSLDEFGPRAFENLSEKEAVTRLSFLDIDAVMTIVLLDKKQESVYVANGPIQRPNFWNYYGPMYQRIYSRGYWVTDTKYFWESNFYELKDGALLYSVQTQSFDPSNTGNLAHEYGLMIIKDMVQNNVIKNVKTVLKGF